MLQDVVVHRTVTRSTYTMTRGTPWNPPQTLKAKCPPLPPGVSGTTTGQISPGSLSGSYHLAGALWFAAMLVLVLACYLTARSSLNRTFVLKWYTFWVGAVILGAAIPLAVLSFAHPTLIPGTCSAIRTAIGTSLAFEQILPTMLAAAGWAFAAFPALSLLLTWVAGWHPASGGFFHYRGCPWPRWNPFAS